MSYQVLARKWRPRDFASLVGQEHVVKALTHALEQKRLHHAWLFTGTRGVGKTTLSRILAKALNCVGPDGTGGITATPCNQCEVCTAIDAGRFVDYIEMDAASNRGVDEMTAVLERAVYAPSSARFKVYMIDEVHMLTTHAFNAMLKTLEEPPEYVKFILATTDPQKIPVTVLSRCLQFNLKQMTPAAIVSRLAEMAQAEGVPTEPAALRVLAHAARGSMRDAQSLFDQAIAFAAGNVTLESVREMLGAIDSSVLVRLLDALAAREAKQMLAIADEMAARSFSFAQALRDLGSLLHWIALAQQVPDAIGDDVENAAEVVRLAQTFAPEEVQVYYQIALHGRNDLGLAPDEYAGFTMTLLRLLAFAPEQEAAAPVRQAALVATRPPRTSAPAPARDSNAAAAPTAPRAESAGARVSASSGGASASCASPSSASSAGATRPSLPSATARPQAASSAVETCNPADSDVPLAGASRAGVDWPALVAQLPLAAMTRELATRSQLVAVDGDHYQLRVPVKALAENSLVDRLKAALAEFLGRPVRLTVSVGAVDGPTAAARAEQERNDLQSRAEASIYNDPFVKQLIDNFGAKVDPQSIRPIQSKD